MNDSVRLRAVVEAFPFGIIYMDEAGKVLMCNGAAGDIFGWSEADVVGSALPFMLNEPSWWSPAMFETLLRGEAITGGEFRHLRKDGMLIDISVSMSPVRDDDGNIAGFMGVFADITKQKRSREYLVESEALYRSIFETSCGPTLVIEDDGTITMVNDEFETITGYSRRDIENRKDWTELIAPEDVNRLREYYDNRALYKNAELKHYETVIVNKYGLRKNVYASFKNITGSAKCIMSVVDITEHKQVSKALEEQARLSDFSAEIGNALSREEDLQRLLKCCTNIVVNKIDASLCCIWLYDTETKTLVMQSISGAYAELDNTYNNIPLGMYEIGDIGLNRKPVMTNNALTEVFINDSDWARREGFVCFGGYPLVVEEQLMGVMAMFCRKRVSEFAFRAMVAAADNIATGIKRKFVEVEIKLKHTELQDLNRRLEHRVAEEILQRQQKEQMLIQQSKMAAMGEMIGAIAHQWRQPLNAVGLIVQDLEDAYEYGEINREYIQRAVTDTMKQIQFMSKTIDDFRNFFRPTKEKEMFNCLSAINSMLSIVSAQLSNNSISVKVTAQDENSLFVNGFPNEFKQAVLNVINNSKDAIIDNRKKLSQSHGKGLITINVFKENNKTVVVITDNGGGVEAGIIDRVFEPYFTTKEQGKGTGIGLYMSKTIIERNMDGRLDVRNVPNGAEFRIEL
ncbi:multi-sensor signal transduction histidine kinase [Candidatus Magnetobacterium bavaricum]|uniref:histidine kinase n=1 Tax=Candidatus Magnetobacterium bavaricum TaxID=29290 RepID=A0A0F3GKW6_9BACT|nr:multi-sensor signal transduction histidine kinase [Candidatus Magnetobacterium bavaricum]